MHVHADKIYHQRFNFFLVAESMLVVSYVTSLTYILIPSLIGIGICILGLIFTTIWFYVNARLEYRVTFMITNYLKKNETYKNYIECVGGAYSNLFLVYMLPISMNILWVLFLSNSLAVNQTITLIFIVSSFILLVLFGAWMKYILLPKYNDTVANRISIQISQQNSPTKSSQQTHTQK